jgi:chromosome segregation ATPase
VLEAALARTGSQDAPHTALAHARAEAAHTARQNELRAERAAARERVAAELQRRQSRPLPAEHARAVRQLEQCRAEREQLRTDRDGLHGTVQQTRTELEALPRWTRSRRSALTETISSSEQRLRQTGPTQGSLDAEIDRLTRQVAQHTRQRLASDLAAPHRARAEGWDLGRAGELARSRPAPVGDPDLSTIRLPGGREPYRGAERDLGDGLSL